MSIRVRFAPSPTGFLHVGGARTALFNWLFARQNQGTFILRIEDTDVKRSDEDMVQGILEGLTWLGLDWDEGPYFQSQRLDHYTATADRLLAAGYAYRDFSEANRGSDAHLEFRDLPEAEVQKRLTSGESFAVRFKTPKGQKVSFIDLVFGEVTVETDNVEDFVILRSDGYPTYHLSVVVDDTEMGITHVVRGADHLSNTSKHALLYGALGAELPTYVHLPLILGLDKKRLSKRHGATSVTEYRDSGFLPEALFNYLALLGWSPGDDSEFLSVSELTERFSLERINKANAVFDPAKLDWMNKRYISSFPAEDLAPYIQQELEKAGLWQEDFLGEKKTWFLSVLELLKTRAGALADFPVYGRAFFTDDFE
ncbi:MAG: glutamate--tRNA ligase, partial [Acidobacteriota bacterium]